MRKFTAFLFYAAVPTILAFGQETELRFADYPATTLYKGPAASLRFSEKSDERYRPLVQQVIEYGVNFAGQYRVVKFRTGNGPIGVLIADLKSGIVSRLPRETVQDGIYLYDACLKPYGEGKKELMDDHYDSFALTYGPGSELLIVMSCTGFSVEKSYFRRHDERWELIKRGYIAPPPPAPVINYTSLTPPHPIR
jgi:hypothetical protein